VLHLCEVTKTASSIPENDRIYHFSVVKRAENLTNFVQAQTEHSVVTSLDQNNCPDIWLTDNEINFQHVYIPQPLLASVTSTSLHYIN
jgi:hypothetical protein